MGKELQWGYKAIEEITITSETEEGRLILKVLDQKDKEIKKFEAETTQLKERIAELEAENELCEKVHLMVHNENQTNLNRIAELKAEVLRQKKWGMQRRDDAHRFNSENKKLQAELQELKSGIKYQFTDQATPSEIDKIFEVTIKEKKQ